MQRRLSVKQQAVGLQNASAPSRGQDVDAQLASRVRHPYSWIKGHLWTPRGRRRQGVTASSIACALGAGAGNYKN
jgi:hypothetical protein